MESVPDGVFDVLEAIGGHTVSLTWAGIRGALIWALAALALTLLLYFGLTRMGWLEPAGRRSRGARIAFALVLFLVCGPVLTAAGVADGLRIGVREAIVMEARRVGVLPPVGAVLLVPAVLSHGAATMPEGAGTDALVDRCIKMLAGDEQVTFLLNKAQRAQAVDGIQRLSSDVVRAVVHDVVEAAPELVALRSSTIGRWTLAAAEYPVQRAVGGKLARYRELLDEAPYPEKAPLGYLPASGAVGESFLRLYLVSYIEGPFRSTRNTLVFVAVGPVLLTVGLIQLVLRRRG